ncbi:TetR/AcrR family transcriptional regulator [Streptomyces drozdowiczii]|uniref:TetR/AcrR family transcriptional regulator n=1 Tax=Streptomyces drozdowiczii TaxID=202862 RepID=A0ABY6PKV9_9ACTN|nr:TetR/AcrR family transcriptional regulator [Streptomyces drozdowiczii]MCX0247753.1 TetR/AcrR family transcriptional regulator [Streptomyces drozdowiczii]UZK52882.1 TetR/AcrR family transcriptional regulator [Streptomyces drozdowiczii]
MFGEHVHSTRAEQKRRTAARIVRAAARLFHERGFQSTTVRQIASEAEVSVGAVMAVGDKESLLSLVYDQAIADRIPAPPEPVEAGAAPPAVDYLTHYFDPFLALFAENDDLARAYFRTLARGRPENAALGTLRTLSEGNLTAAMVNDGMDEARARLGAQVMFAGYLGELMLLAAGTTEPRQTAARLGTIAAFVTAQEGN